MSYGSKDSGGALVIFKKKIFCFHLHSFSIAFYPLIVLIVVKYLLHYQLIVGENDYPISYLNTFIRKSAEQTFFSKS